jgi:hypothetical protein
MPLKGFLFGLPGQERLASSHSPVTRLVQNSSCPASPAAGRRRVHPGTQGLQRMERPFSNPLVKGMVLFLVALAGVNLLYAVIGFYAIPAVLKAQVPKQLSPLVKRTVTVGPVEFNPYSLKLLIKDFKVASPESGETLASGDELALDIEGQSIIRQSLILKEIILADPAVNIIINEDNTFNFTDILNNKEKPEPNLSSNSPDSKNSKNSFIFILKNIAIRNGTVNILDNKTFSSHTITSFNLFVPSLYNYKNDID